MPGRGFSPVRKGILELAWNQWAQVGLSAHVRRRDVWSIDPEGLILFSFFVARHDVRLFDEVLDWLALNGDLISLQRLRNIWSHWSMDPDLLEAALKTAKSANPSLPWKAQRRQKDSSHPNMTLFHRADVGLREADEIFLEFGYVRPRVDLSAKSQRPDPTVPAALAFKLRLLLGVGARAEVVRMLLTSKDLFIPTRQIAEVTSYSKRVVRETANTMVEARALRSSHQGNEQLFGANLDLWQGFLGISEEEWPRFADWTRLFKVLIRILGWIEQDESTGRTEYMRASGAAELLRGLEPDLKRLGLTIPWGPASRGQFYLDSFRDFALGVLGEFVRRGEAS